MGVLVEEVMLDLPRVVEAEAVGEHYLLQRLLEQAMLVAVAPWLGQLQLVEDPEAHTVRPDCIVANLEAWHCRAGSATMARGRAGGRAAVRTTAREE